MILHREEPFIEAFLRRIRGIGEFVKAVAQNEATLRAEVAALGTDIVDRLAALPWPAPAPVDELADGRAVAGFPARRHVGDSHTRARPPDRRPLGHLYLYPEVVQNPRAQSQSD